MKKLDVRRLRLVELARLMAQHSPGITIADVRADVKAGCPVNVDGTISLVVYVAWLVKEP